MESVDTATRNGMFFLTCFCAVPFIVWTAFGWWLHGRYMTYGWRGFLPARLRDFIEERLMR